MPLCIPATHGPENHRATSVTSARVVVSIALAALLSQTATSAQAQVKRRRPLARRIEKAPQAKRLRGEALFSLPTDRKNTRNATRLSPNGRWLAYHDRHKGVLEIWDIARRRVHQRFSYGSPSTRVHGRASFSFGHRSNIVILSSSNTTCTHAPGKTPRNSRRRRACLHVWRISDGKQLLVAQPPHASTSSCRRGKKRYQFFTDDGDHVLFAFCQHTLRLYDLRKRQARCDIALHKTSGVNLLPRVLPMAEGRYVGVYSYDRHHTISIYSGDTCERLKMLHIPTRSQTRGRRTICWRHSFVGTTKTSLVASNGCGAVWEIGSFKQRFIIDDHAVINHSKDGPGYAIHGDTLRLKTKRGRILDRNLLTGETHRYRPSLPLGLWGAYSRDRRFYVSMGRSNVHLLTLALGRHVTLVDHLNKKLETTPHFYGTAKHKELRAIIGGSVVRWLLPRP